MNLHSKYVADRILESASELSPEIYDCCVGSCVCFVGEFENHTNCPICEEPRYDQRKKARNRFRYIPIIPRLQAIFKDPKLIELMLHRVRHDSDPNIIEDVLDGGVIQRLLNTYVKIDGKKKRLQIRRI